MKRFEHEDIYVEKKMKSIPLAAELIPVTEKKTNYPAPFALLVEGRTKRKLGDYFGLTNFGVNLTQLAPGAISALRHHHSRQDEFIYILQGTPTLILGEENHALKPGDCFGFKAGSGVAHQLVNHANELAIYIEMGDRSTGDEVEYPYDDLQANQLANGGWAFTRKDGHTY